MWRDPGWWGSSRRSDLRPAAEEAEEEAGAEALGHVVGGLAEAVGVGGRHVYCFKTRYSCVACCGVQAIRSPVWASFRVALFAGRVRARCNRAAQVGPPQMSGAAPGEPSAARYGAGAVTLPFTQSLVP